MPECKLTVGKKDNKNGEWPYAGTVDTVRNMGADAIEKDVTEIQVDDNYKVVTTPAYMKNASYFEVFSGIGKMVDELLKLCK